VWPRTASIVSRSHEFAALDMPDPDDRDTARADARRWAKTAISRDETDPALWLELAEQERVTDRLDDAEAHYLQALRFDPFSVSAMTGLGRVALARGDERDALEWFERALAIRENDRLRELVEQLS
jgi:tetratricopeptide (TPR) repeat protein